jgi:hypothetical protein
MLKYLYIPEDKEISDHIDFAVMNNFNQIIHGRSEIVENLICDYDEVQEINIPEYREVLNRSLVFKEKETFKLILIDEFYLQDGYNVSDIEIYRLDDIDLNKKEFILRKKMDKVDECIYEVELNLDVYGEYIYEIQFETDMKLNTENRLILLKDSIVIYKEYEENQGEINDKFFFD